MRLAGWDHRFQRFFLNADGRTDGHTDGRTDTPSYRDATAHLKIGERGRRRRRRCRTKQKRVKVREIARKWVHIRRKR